MAWLKSCTDCISQYLLDPSRTYIEKKVRCQSFEVWSARYDPIYATQHYIQHKCFITSATKHGVNTLSGKSSLCHTSLRILSGPSTFVFSVDNTASFSSLAANSDKPAVCPSLSIVSARAEKNAYISAVSFNITD